MSDHSLEAGVHLGQVAWKILTVGVGMLKFAEGIPSPDRERLQEIGGKIKLLCKHLRGVATNLQDPEEDKAWLPIDPRNLGANIELAVLSYLKSVTEEVREITDRHGAREEEAPS